VTERLPPDGLIVRPAKASDVPTIVALIVMGAPAGALDRAAAEAEGRDPVYAAAFERVAAAGNQHLFVADLNGRIIGTYQLSVLPGIAQRGRVRGKLESVHTDPECRSRGVGEAMMRHAITIAKAEGIGLLELSSDKRRDEAHRFYRRLGFAQSHEGFKMALDV
jgi:GNAT superfamily N-acetyltransferase